MELKEVLLVIIYTLLFSLIIYRTQLFSDSKLSKSFIIGLFLLKLLFCYLYAYVHYENGWRDTFYFFNSGKMIYSLLPEYPDEYIKLIFSQYPNQQLPYEITNHIGREDIPGYGLTRTDFVIRFHALLMLFSQGSYIVQCVLFEFVSLIGIIYIYSFVVNFFNNNKKYLKLFIFFSPSLLFWLSGMHKETLALFSIGIILYNTYKLFNTNRLQNIVGILIGLTLLFYIRDYVFLMLIMPLAAFLFSHYSKIKVRVVYTVLMLVNVFFFFLSSALGPSYDLMAKFIKYQKAFLGYQSTSKFHTQILEHNPWSFIKAIPLALYNSMTHPSIFEIHSVLSAIGALETSFYLILGAIFLYFGKYKGWTEKQQAVLLFFVTFAISYFILLGLIVNNSGALIRYKSTPLLFLGTVIILLFDENKWLNYKLQVKNKK